MASLTPLIIYLATHPLYPPPFGKGWGRILEGRRSLPSLSVNTRYFVGEREEIFERGLLPLSPILPSPANKNPGFLV